MIDFFKDFSNHKIGLETSRKKILDTIEDSSDITFIIAGGNIGDHLIWEGTKHLLAVKKFKTVLIKDVENLKGHTALITGSGGWCKPFHTVGAYLPIIEKNFKRVIILPSSFDPSEASVKRALSQTKARVFARELRSFKLIKDLCHADYAYDCAFFFNFAPYKTSRKGTLLAYRTDSEKASSVVIPKNNKDISRTCNSLDQWLKIIAMHDTIYTDRAHVMIASAMLDKRVFYKSTYYHKVPAIAEFSLKDFPVYFQK